MTGDLKKHVNDVLDRETDTPALRTSLLDMIHEKDANYSMGQLINYISRRWVRLIFELHIVLNFYTETKDWRPLRPEHRRVQRDRVHRNLSRRDRAHGKLIRMGPENLTTNFSEENGMHT